MTMTGRISRQVRQMINISSVSQGEGAWELVISI
jgi:hypothetical protein